MLPIVGWQKTSLLDYPERLSTIFFTQGCNFRCPYCHNPQLVQNFAYSELSLIPEEVIWDHLTKRKHLIDGVVITGGEPTLHEDKLETFLHQLKKESFLVKLDTNGTNPTLLKKLITNNLLDYVAMDIKTSLEEYNKLTRVKSNIKDISESIDLLKNSTNYKLIELEFRVTLHPFLHNDKNIQDICNMVAGSPRLVLQTFRNDLTLDPDYNETHPFSHGLMKKYQHLAGQYVGECLIR